MLWRHVVQLISQTPTTNAYNEKVYVDDPPRDVYANKKSVRQSEFYQAVAVGVKPEIVFEVMCCEYCEETKLIFEGIPYHIIRTYSKNDEKIELVCSRYPIEGVQNG